MKSLVFATNNSNKLREVRAMLEGRFQIISLKELGCEADIPETGDTLEYNSNEKTAWIADRYDVEVFGEDTGLIVPELGGEPGVYSARYAGPQRSAEDNMDLLLQKLEGSQDRSAKFRTVFTLILKSGSYQFTGECAGKIARERMGGDGFGYDPIFVPQGGSRSFAQMSGAEKAKISHRGRGLEKLISFLDNL